MSERLEHELNQLDSKTVCVVRPGYGNQSDSWTGILTSDKDDYPIHFHFSVPGFAIRFTATDVVKIDPVKIDSSLVYHSSPVIRLKGPQDYTSRLQYTVS